ncbi:MAG: HlyD family efflux transporter periplasmic adaptor subunit [Bacteroidetes bacterium]|nr:HlyD family efflux transporter periplasmic adaptor subunit [Bacteroidota bacterium]MBU1718846.1 HlyD family efflux transporter periplasmic adaptor subunit [Bacteroidota bacterium]
MKRTLLYLIPIMAILAACSSDKDKSDAYGNFESLEVTISSEVSGIILLLNIEEGMQVKAGDIAGYIDTTQLYLRKQQVKAQAEAVQSKTANIRSQIDVQKAQLEALMVEKDRVEKLVKDGAMPQKNLDDINGKVHVIETQIKAIETQNAPILSELKVIESQLDQLNDQITKSVIRIPINGVIVEKYAEQAELAIPGKALFQVARLDELDLRVYVNGGMLSQLKIGQNVKVLTDGPDGSIEESEGIVTWISDKAEFTPKIIQTRDERVSLVYAVKVRVKNDGRFKMGMPGEIRII